VCDHLTTFLDAADEFDRVQDERRRLEEAFATHEKACTPSGGGGRNDLWHRIEAIRGRVSSAVIANNKGTLIFSSLVRWEGFIILSV
jgi:hypothetical protein